MDTRQALPRASRGKFKERSRYYRLTKRIGIDIVTAGAAALTVSPIMTVIDRAVIEAAAGQSSILLSMRTSMSIMLRNPGRLVHNRPFKLMLLLYGGTYLTANVIDTASSYHSDLPASTTTSTWSKFVMVSTVNVGLSLYKDSEFARMFGKSSTRAMRVASFVPFVARDGLTIFATFNIPQLVAPSLPEYLENAASRLSIAQLVSPAAMQIFATPLHLLGLDVYNRPGVVPTRDRARRIWAKWMPASLARMCRIVPAYGLGGVVNTNMRRRLMDGLT